MKTCFLKFKEKHVNPWGGGGVTKKKKDGGRATVVCAVCYVEEQGVVFSFFSGPFENCVFE